MKKEKIILLIVWILIVSSGCGRSLNQNDPTEEIMKTDLAFSKYSEENGTEAAFLAFADEKSVLLRDGGLPLVGKPALREHMEKSPSGNIILTWKPLFAETSSSGDLGYTYGTYEVRSNDNPEEKASEGCYVSIWKKQTDGTWKWVLDSGTEGLKEKEIN